MFLGRIALAKVVDANKGQSLNGQNLNECNVFTATLKLFQKAAAANPSTLVLQDITAQTVEIINTNHMPLMVGEQVIVVQGPDERWFTLQKPLPRVQFVTTGKIVDRAVQVKVIRAMNAPPNIDNLGRVLEYGDTLTVYDPFNKWSDIEADATGWAYLAHQQDDDLSTSEIDEAHVARYEIEECSLPINEIYATLKDCLMGGNTEGTAMVQLEPENIRSAYPNVDRPPEIGEPQEGETEVELLFRNRFALDGIAGSGCVLRRVTNLLESDPENYTAPTPRSSTLVHWELVSVAEKIARHIKVSYSAGGSTWTAEEFYDGFDPTTSPSPEGSSSCDITINCTLCECDSIRYEQGDEGYAFLDTTAEEIEYHVYSTKSAFFPLPKRHKILAVEETDGGPVSGPLIEFGASDCQLNYKETYAQLLCWEGPNDRHAPIPTVNSEVLSCDGTSFAIESCVGSCDWTWSDPVDDWVKTTPCSDPDGLGCDCEKPARPENPTQGQTAQSDCGGSSQLCLTLGTKNIKVIGCPQPTETGSCTEFCIPVGDGGGGGNGGGSHTHECPDPCATSGDP